MTLRSIVTGRLQRKLKQHHNNKAKRRDNDNDYITLNTLMWINNSSLYTRYWR